MLTILPYHKTVTEYFKKQSEVWQFFSNHKHRDEQLLTFKTDVLKNTYRFTEDGEKELYDDVLIAKEKLGLDLPVTLYQLESADDLNASIVFLNGEVHIVFSGKIISLLDREERLAVIAHELSHVLLYRQLDGDVEVADRIVAAMGNDARASPGHYETAKLFRLYTEIFCDRGAHLVTGNQYCIVSALVKIATGLSTVNAAGYISQAEAIFESDRDLKTNGVSHPENYIRARAISLWHNDNSQAEDQIVRMIEGEFTLHSLDLFRQIELTAITEKLIMTLLYPEWMNTPKVTALAGQYFPGTDFKHVRRDKDFHDMIVQDLESYLRNAKPDILEYLSYVLYDFATADQYLEDVPLGHGFDIATKFHLSEAFFATVRKERKLSEKKTAALKDAALKSLQTS